MAQVQQRPYIHIEEYTSMVDIIEQNHVCTGVVVRTKDGQIQPIYAKSGACYRWAGRFRLPVLLTIRGTLWQLH